MYIPNNSYTRFNIPSLSVEKRRKRDIRSGALIKMHYGQAEEDNKVYSRPENNWVPFKGGKGG